jgi:hypothetical protein
MPKKTNLDDTVLSDSGNIREKSKDGLLISCKFCMISPLKVRCTFGPFEWNNHVVSAAHIKAASTRDGPTTSIAYFMCPKASSGVTGPPMPSLPQPNNKSVMDVAGERSNTETKIFKCPGVNLGNTRSLHLSIFMKYGMLDKETISCKFKVEEYIRQWESHIGCR